MRRVAAAVAPAAVGRSAASTASTCQRARAPSALGLREGAGADDGGETLAAAPTRACLKDVPILGDNDLYIGRGFQDRSGRILSASPWANPFRVRDCATVYDCIQKFEAHLLASPRLLDRRPELDGKRLVCHCKDSAPCHADVIDIVLCCV